MNGVALLVLASLLQLAQSAGQPPLATVVRQGYRLTVAEAQQLEQRLNVNTDDLPARARLLGYWFSRGRQDVGVQATVAARRRHILWLIANHPDSEICGLSEATLDRDSRFSPLADKIGYEQARELWMARTLPQSANIATLANAAFFFKLPAKPLSAALYARLLSIDPQNPQWSVLHAAVLAYAIVGVAAMNQNGFPLAVDPAEANSVFATKVRRDLEATADANLLLMVSGVLSMQGAMVAGDRPEILRLAERYATRARDLDPTNAAFAGPSDRQLAETYGLQALQTRDAAERARLLRQRLVLLEKIFSAASLNDPGKASELLELARARADAGEMEGAADLASTLVRLAPQIAIDPQTGTIVDQVRHHAHLILGRAALRAGNVPIASQELLAAGKVGGGGTLSSFGPNMTLAKELLEKGNREVVIQYLEECRTFWKLGRNLNSWIAAIRNGRIPEFGPNLIY